MICMGEIATWGKLAAAFDGIFWIGRIRDHVSSSQKFSDDRILWGTAELAGVSDLCTCHARIFLPVSCGMCLVHCMQEVLARWLKAPSTLFFIVAMIPLIPGSTLYYSMSCAVYGQLAQASIYGLQTFQCALGIVQA